MRINIKRLIEIAMIPTRQHEGDAGTVYIQICKNQ